jgi:hypothetical protein
MTADVPDVRPSRLAPSRLAPSRLAPSRLALPSYARPRERDRRGALVAQPEPDGAGPC